jgi:signal transduction histidine kinase
MTPIHHQQGTVAQTRDAEIARLRAENEALTNELRRYKETGAQITRFANQLHTAADVSKQLSSILDVDLLLEKVVTLVKQRFNLYHVHVYLLDEEKEMLCISVGSGHIGKLLRQQAHSISLYAKNSLVAKAARTQKTILVGNVSEEPSFLPNPLLPDTRSEIAVPLIAAGVVLGVLDVQDDEPNRFDQIDVDTFKTFSGHIATALQNAYLFDEQKETEQSLILYANRLQSLHQIDKAILTAESPHTIAKTAVQQLQPILPYDRASVAIFDFESQKARLFPADAYRANDPIADHYNIDIITAALEKNNGRPICSNIASFPPDNPIVNMLKGQNIQSIIIYPLRYRSKLIGAINLASAKPDAFNQNDIAIVDEIAAPLAIAIQQARLYEEVRQHAKELEDRNEELEQFAYVASHDLQEPLRIVISYVQLLARKYEGQLDEDADIFIHYAIDAALRMKNLIRDLLNYSRLGTRGKPFADTDCNQVLENVLHTLSLLVEENEATITFDPLPVIQADDVQIGQLLQNLISNAIKFRRDAPPRIHISARREEDMWLFSVQDNGIGIEPQYTERIFAIFQRLHTIEEYPGTGIGLAVCKKIVDRHNGRLWLESQYGEGTTFFFTIPA